ncbi:nitrogen-fixing NifU domain protein [Solidesulfovibrio fructosivorans JJ]]|uniref:Nitrogen-fixing NifU domain protein n=1 Tax=Solidesulfovibrio fructosivorans JJ] TaxID=596151 RepID=E1K1Y7_SOLFR|nr:iron-sulfur cluster assembly scaffold protein [Solidesulfovibrio fructosivorans]EFL49393.1 nitrogen-fixing NifU domain protein [Solidesulfovibrio fructosivorans JJ]]
MATERDPNDPLSMVLDVFEEEQQAALIERFGEKGFQIWHDAPNRTRLAEPTAVGRVKGSCGDTIVIALGIEDETIVATDFDTDGCASSQIAAATAARLAKGLSLDEAVDIDEAAIVAAVGRFPDDDRHCAYLAAAAVREAVHHWMIQGGALAEMLRKEASGGQGETF